MTPQNLTWLLALEQRAHTFITITVFTCKQTCFAIIWTSHSFACRISSTHKSRKTNTHSRGWSSHGLATYLDTQCSQPHHSTTTCDTGSFQWKWKTSPQTTPECFPISLFDTLPTLSPGSCQNSSRATCKTTSTSPTSMLSNSSWSFLLPEESLTHQRLTWSLSWLLLLPAPTDCFFICVAARHVDVLHASRSPPDWVTKVLLTQRTFNLFTWLHLATKSVDISSIQGIGSQEVEEYMYIYPSKSRVDISYRLIVASIIKTSETVEKDSEEFKVLLKEIEHEIENAKIRVE